VPFLLGRFALNWTAGVMLCIGAEIYECSQKESNPNATQSCSSGEFTDKVDGSQTVNNSCKKDMLEYLDYTDGEPRPEDGWNHSSSAWQDVISIAVVSSPFIPGRPAGAEIRRYPCGP
jgi:hypothetical protein